MTIISKAKKYFSYGATLVEVIMALLLMAILMSFAFPTLSHFFVNARDQQLQNQLENATSFAMQTAQLRHQPIYLCLSDDKISCAKQGKYLVVFTHSPQSSSISYPELLLWIEELKLAGGKLYLRHFLHFRSYLSFTENHWNDNAAIWYCRAREKHPAWAFLLAAESANARVVYPNSANEIKDKDGISLQCVN